MDQDRIGKNQTFAESDNLVRKANDKLQLVKDTAFDLDNKFDYM